MLKKILLIALLFCSSIRLLSGYVFAQNDPAFGNTVEIEGNIPGNGPILENDPSINKDNFKGLLEETIDPIKENLETTPPTLVGGVDGIVVFIIDLFKTYIFPLTIILAILAAIFGFMDIMQSDSEDKRKKGIDYFIGGTIGIIIFTGAEFIFNNLYSIVGEIQNGGQSRNIYASKIYSNIIYPFLKLAMYLVLGGLFISMLIKTIEYIVSPSEKVTTQGRTIIISAAMGIIVILLAKTMVEAVYNKQSSITTDSGTVFIGGGLFSLDSDSFQKIFAVINYVLGVLAFIVLCLIIYQAYMMLFNSNSDDTIKKLRKNLLYIFGGLVLIGLSFILVNVLIVN